MIDGIILLLRTHLDHQTGQPIEHGREPGVVQPVDLLEDVEREQALVLCPCDVLSVKSHSRHLEERLRILQGAGHLVMRVDADGAIEARHGRLNSAHQELGRAQLAQSLRHALAHRSEARAVNVDDLLLQNDRTLILHELHQKGAGLAVDLGKGL